MSEYRHIMKQIFPFLLAAAIMPLTAQTAEQTADTITAPAVEPEIIPSHPGAAHLEAALEFAMTCDELATLLQPVTDWSSANKAVPETEKIVDRLTEIREQMSGLPAPTPEIEAYVTEQLAKLDTEAIAERSLGRVIDLLTLTDPPCYGSKELAAPLLRLAEQILGGK